ncbi:unnamed protein product [Acanthosepion pharaonis]|uniref:Uncharacterized protein n=1 Tax=Acanthosepion pharaonis TaxID=158019 RepID=A0A812F090_ACAPH|nr:unnamed protein product [Sepia pharaonis]
MYSALLSTRRTRLLIFLLEKTLSIFNRMTSSFLFLLILSASTCIHFFFHCHFSYTSLSRPNPLHFAIRYVYLLFIYISLYISGLFCSHILSPISATFLSSLYLRSHIFGSDSIPFPITISPIFRFFYFAFSNPTLCPLGYSKQRDYTRIASRFEPMRCDNTFIISLCAENETDPRMRNPILSSSQRSVPLNGKKSECKHSFFFFCSIYSCYIFLRSFRYFSTILCLALKTFITGLTVSTFFLFFDLFNSFSFFYILFIFFSFCPLPFDAIKSITLFSEGGPSDTIDLHIVHITVGKSSAFPWCRHPSHIYRLSPSCGTSKFNPFSHHQYHIFPITLSIQSHILFSLPLHPYLTFPISLSSYILRSASTHISHTSLPLSPHITHCIFLLSPSISHIFDLSLSISKCSPPSLSLPISHISLSHFPH